MDKDYYKELIHNFELKKDLFNNKIIYVFGHCNASEELIDLLIENNYNVKAILDNNINKYNVKYRNISVKSVCSVLEDNKKSTIVLIVSRAYASMSEQLRKMGFKGSIEKLIDYNSYSEYSLTEETITKMKARVEAGIILLNKIEKKYNGYFKIFCPFAALGDICFTMAYLPYFMKKRNIEKCVICVIGNACEQVVRLYGNYPVEVFNQKNIDETIQAVLYTENKTSFIAHQDRPYVINLHKALYIRCIPLEQIYCCGVYGLPKDIEPCKPINFQTYDELENIEEGKSVIFSPYAKSVTVLKGDLWDSIVRSYKENGFTCFTNVVGDEVPLDGTLPISPKISEMQSVVEKAGHFVGIRSGLCDVIKYANCCKIALYPDYYYSDTKWKAIDMYSLDGWENIVVGDDFKWEMK